MGGIDFEAEHERRKAIQAAKKAARVAAQDATDLVDLETGQRDYWDVWAKGGRAVLQRKVDYFGVQDLSTPAAGQSRGPRQEDAERIAVAAFEKALPMLKKWRLASSEQVNSAFMMSSFGGFAMVCAAFGIGYLAYIITAEANTGLGVGFAFALVAAVASWALAAWMLDKVGKNAEVTDQVQELFKPFNEELAQEMPRYHLRASKEKGKDGLSKASMGCDWSWTMLLSGAPNWVVVMELLTKYSPEAAAAVPQATDVSYPAVIVAKEV